MKKIILITLLISLFVEGNYLVHPKSQALIDELVINYGFEKSFVEDVLSNAVRQQKIIDSISKPAEFTWTWDRYKKFSIFYFFFFYKHLHITIPSQSALIMLYECINSSLFHVINR